MGEITRYMKPSVAVVEALDRLVAQQRLGAVMRPGMRFQLNGPAPGVWLRCTAAEGEAVIYVQDREAFGPVMRVIEDGWTSRLMPHPVLPSPMEAEVDLEDAATVGCLLALLREAGGDDEWYLGPSHPWRWMAWRRELDGEFWEETGAYSDSEGGAITKALIALAGGDR